jgi:16S rRNA (cytidine1402-2'-O)-methyltransferase
VATLYVVGTPIGNLADITVRALDVLRSVPLIAAEDTRRTRILLQHYGINTRLVSYHEHSPPSRLAEILDALARHDVALVTDAGMPGIADPGQELVNAAAERGFPVVPIPGPSALTAAVSVSGLVSDGFVFLGFLPRTAQARRARLRQLATLPYPLVLYEAPHRLAATLADLASELGDRPVVICRELTKVHEEITRTTLQHATMHLTAPVKGELVLVIGLANSTPEPSDDEIMSRLRVALAAGHPPSTAARLIANETGLPRNRLYRLALTLQDRGQTES